MDHEKLKSLIEARGLKNSYVAEQVGVSVGTIRLIVSGHRKPGRAVIKLLAQLLEVQEDELILQGEAS